MPVALRAATRCWIIGWLIQLLAQALLAQSVHPLPGRWVDSSDRETVRQFFLSAYVPLQNFPMSWTGNLAAGKAGDTSTAYKYAVISMVNFFRSLAGVPPVITIDLARSAKAQGAALMFAANNRLSHAPPATWLDYTLEGAEAAGKSNICLDTRLPNRPGCVETYIEDSDAANFAVGHRRWVLHPQTLRMGTGDIPPGDQAHPFGANALWVGDAREDFGPRPATRHPFVSWPPPGYIPRQFVFLRWSFSFSGADFDAAMVTLTRDGYPVPLHLQPVRLGFGENTLAWDVARDTPTHAADVTTHVTVSNVMINGAPYRFSYEVTTFDPAQASTSAKSHIAESR